MLLRAAGEQERALSDDGFRIFGIFLLEWEGLSLSFGAAGFLNSR